MERYIWPLKIAVKIVLARLPVPYGAWKKIGIFRHGRMDTSAYALKIFRLHAGSAWPEGLPQHFTALELGPGDSIAAALIAAGYGAKKIYLADVGAFADRDVAGYKAMAESLRREGVPVPDIARAENLQDILTACRAEYLTGGLDSLRSIPAASVDTIWSHSVVEHIRKKDFAETFRELARVLKPSGRMSHNIDLKDHLAQSLNNLRFPDGLWESEFFARSGFYTNRLRSSDILGFTQDAGFEVTSLNQGRWPTLPLPRARMAEPFRSASEDDLYVRTMHVVLRPANAARKAA